MEKGEAAPDDEHVLATATIHRQVMASYGIYELMRQQAMGTKASEPRYYVGLDLGQSRDPTAIAVVRRVDPPMPVPEQEKPKPNYAPGSLEWQEEQRRRNHEAVPA